MKRLMVLMSSAFFVFALSACGGGGGGGAAAGTPAAGTPAAGTSGGRASAPAPVNLNGKNIISKDDSSNYFKINLLRGQTVFFDSFFDGSIDRDWLRQQLNICSAGSGLNSPINLTLNGVRKDSQQCSLANYVKAVEDGEYLIAANLYGSETSGYFDVSVLDGDYIVGSQIGIGGEPNNVGNIDFIGSNVISASYLKNYYSYSGKAGDKLIIHSSMLKDLSSDFTACSASAGAWSSMYSYGICWDKNSDGKLDCSCSKDTTITLSVDGPIVINMKYLYENSGTFTVDKM